MKLHYAIKATDAATHVAFSGDIDASAEHTLATLQREIVKGRRLALDLGRIERINSIGLSFFATFVKVMKVQAAVTFDNCPSVFVDYLNVLEWIKNLGSNVTVTSVLVPVSCGCEAPKPVNLRLPSPDPEAFVDSQRCPTCGKTVAPEVDLEDYLYFAA